MNFLRLFLVTTLLSSLLVNCGAYLNQPVAKQSARTGELTTTSTLLKNLPKPSEPIVVGVYNFRDQTGQYKNIETGSSFSTAVPQGGTTILNKALEDSGWFTVVERENLGNLLNERNIINTTREQYRQAGDNTQKQLPPLLFAGVLLEGGIVSYDSNILTGGAGARYFGVGGSTQYRQDRITVYLRAVSTTNGKVLKTVYISKTILSQAVSLGLFKYVNFQRLLEVETGFTTNEPIQLALTDAIEKAVESMIIEGIQANLWNTKQGKKLDEELINSYNSIKQEQEARLLYQGEQVQGKHKNEIALSGGVNLFYGDLQQKKFGYAFQVAYARKLSQRLAVELNFAPFEIRTGKKYTNQKYSIDTNLRIDLLPKQKTSTYIYLGTGVIGDYFLLHNKQTKDDKFYWKLQYGAGLNYSFNSRFAVFGFAQQNFALTDNLEAVKQGKFKDYYFNFGLGLKYYF
ncbi:CsgG/HfaB family protein [Myroides pelagicus]|uniref:Outer membrane beta-barrel protein n=1 Tax=Myroides pelagicus TaxID=270914 RepID=A0A7K1GPU0_9FLAO|nr:CsgG/HfaB family protein [Myroides pelagicus]MTH30569.1 hypothetical protein [Myroides pelagicus]